MLSDRDYELLSAYLDGALTDSERGALETRLSSEAGLRHELDTLRATVDLIHGLPPLKAPRNFTLDASMVRPARRVTFLTSAAFSAVSAAAAFLLIAGALLLNLTSSALSPAPMQFAVGQASQAEVAAAPTLMQTPASVPLTLSAEREMIASQSAETFTALLPQETDAPAPSLGLAGAGGEGVDEQYAADAALAPSTTQVFPSAALMAPVVVESETPQLLYFSPEALDPSLPAESGALPGNASVTTDTNNDLLETQIGAPPAATADTFSAFGTLSEEAALAITATSEADRIQRQELSPPPPVALPTAQPVASRESVPQPGVNVTVILLAGGLILLTAAIISTVARRRAR